ncbi:MAG: hypothetical protein DRP15_04335 [Candidatus Aenigmatarchaeota archaeon]|nr:MAG: hypothetical protein DRP15_04335 [Candidatus Aenigmarchaeota archaeon]
MAKITIYTTPSCPTCFMLKEFLKDKGVDFEEVDVSTNQEAAQRIFEKTGALSVPVVESNGKFIVGFKMKEILELIE